MWAVFFHTHAHTHTHAELLQHPKISSWERKKHRGEQLSKYHSNKIFQLLWDPPLLVQHQEKWSGKGLLLVCFLWGKTPNGLNRATAEGKLLTATTKWTTDDCKGAAVWVSDRIRACSGEDQTPCMYIDFDQTPLLVGAPWSDWMCVNWNSSGINVNTAAMFSKRCHRKVLWNNLKCNVGDFCTAVPAEIVRNFPTFAFFPQARVTQTLESLRNYKTENLSSSTLSFLAFMRQRLKCNKWSYTYDIWLWDLALSNKYH